MRRDLFERLQAARAAARQVGVLTELDSGRQWLLGLDHDDGDSAPGGAGAPAAPAPALLDEARRMLTDDRSGRVAVTAADGADPGDAAGRWFLRTYSPPLRLFIVGAVHIAQVLAPVAALAGYAVTVIDPRQAWASAARFPNNAVCDDWPDRALEAARLDRRCALVTLSHDPKLDDPALTVGLRSPAFYIGALGSRRTHAARLQRLAEAGFDQADCGRIHAPIGLDLGGRSPAEIALAIAAEIVQTLHRGPARRA